MSLVTSAATAKSIFERLLAFPALLQTDRGAIQKGGQERGSVSRSPVRPHDSSGSFPCAGPGEATAGRRPALRSAPLWGAALSAVLQGASPNLGPCSRQSCCGSQTRGPRFV